MVAIIARGISKFTPELEQLFNAMAGAGVGGEGPKILDADALIDEIIAKKGPHQYKGGLSEDNWEQVHTGGGGGGRGGGGGGGGGGALVHGISQLGAGIVWPSLGQSTQDDSEDYWVGVLYIRWGVREQQGEGGGRDGRRGQSLLSG